MSVGPIRTGSNNKGHFGGLFIFLVQGSELVFKMSIKGGSGHLHNSYGALLAKAIATKKISSTYSMGAILERHLIFTS